MSAQDAVRRSKRRAVDVRAPGDKVPSAVHYLGYVEDEETPEMIMRKFEELERFKGSNGETCAPQALQTDDEPADEDPELTEEQMVELFKQTSVFSVTSALGNNQILQDPAAAACPSSGRVSKDMRSMLPGLDQAGRRAKGGGGADAPRDPATRTQTIVLQYGDHFRTLVKKIPLEPPSSVAGPSTAAPAGLAPAQRDPPPSIANGASAAAESTQPPAPPAASATSTPAAPIARSAPAVSAPSSSSAAAATVQNDGVSSLSLPARPLPVPVHADELRRAATISSAPPAFDGSSPAGQLVRAPDICAVDWGLAPFATPFQAVLINDGWVPKDAQTAQGDAQPSEGPSQPGTRRQHARLAAAARAAKRVPPPDVAARLRALPLNRLVPHGFVFLWTHKRHISAVFELLTGLGYVYVENLTWVLIGDAGEELLLPDHFARRSHLSLYIFRFPGVEGKSVQLRHQRNADVFFDTVRPGSGCNWVVPAQAYNTIETLLPAGKGNFLELWASSSACRPGWTHVAELSEEDPERNLP